ncbi:hypothetical protein JOD43_002741 [Pullulanibacillus pueri]|uniref:Uncharacterized protein n=1 Tax=Pullulanibacillus pueri TaxID=1437324 RepID=A0A8J3EMW7_9BACL|nr:hypothetical protein [Pullulanibacillus pueri]MBM7682562.1 hypothetical protein [Pullulanibacillus pueri]GGH82309.1 hypothetical protein GCM10007096_21500 [Pullulanibacillus pueri]
MEKIKRTGIVLSTLLVIILLFSILYYSMSFSKALVIRRTLFLNGHPIGALTTSIQNKPNTTDSRYGSCYAINNPKISDGSENSIPGVCMKKNKFGMYYDISIGTL